MARRNEGIIAFLMILALVAFVIGSAIGISVSMTEHDNQTQNNTTVHVENVTHEMISPHNTPAPVEYDYEADNVDFNQNVSMHSKNN
ncbi:hypothetical protein [Methanobrevibacter sp.]|uniref:hypothetical protein n=1 Tax=Methanobrevibacter sp. TaxID=66852 RepID=UPI00388F5729